LLRLRDIVGSQLVIVRYEDMVSSLKYLEPVLSFCGVTATADDEDYLHRKSLHKWKNDRLFGFALSSDTIELAEKYGYQKGELINESHLLWPVFSRLSRAAYIAGKPVNKFRRNILKRIRPIVGA